MAGPVADLMEFDTRNKEIDQKKKEQKANLTMANANQLNESTMIQNNVDNSIMGANYYDMD